MSARIPTAASVSESAVISAPLHAVWHLIKLQDFPKFWRSLASAEPVKGASPDTDVVRWTFRDGTTQEVKLEEHSSIDHFVSYSVISSDPAISYSSVINKVRLYAVTSGDAQGSTFVEWSAFFSTDADAGVIEDARYKRREALADLAKHVKG